MPEDPAAPSNQLDDLSSAELHRRAVDLAHSRHDAKFLWRLLEYTPAAEALSGRYEEAQGDIEQFPIWVDDAIDREGKLDAALRPVYLNYLRNAPADHAEGVTTSHPHSPDLAPRHANTSGADPRKEHGMNVPDKAKETAERAQQTAAEDKQHIQEAAQRAQQSARVHGAAARERLAEAREHTHAPHRKGDGTT